MCFKQILSFLQLWVMAISQQLSKPEFNFHKLLLYSELKENLLLNQAQIKNFYLHGKWWLESTFLFQTNFVDSLCKGIPNRMEPLSRKSTIYYWLRLSTSTQLNGKILLVIMMLFHKAPFIIILIQVWLILSVNYVFY